MQKRRLPFAQLVSYAIPQALKRGSTAVLFSKSARALPSMRMLFTYMKTPCLLRSMRSYHGAVDKTESKPEAPASVTCPSMDFTRWSSEE